jgi:hypothetical protein
MALRFLNSGYFAGKVGIGTDSPGASLEIGSLVADSAGLKFSSPGSEVNVNFTFIIGDTGLGLHAKNLVIKGSSATSDIAFSPSSSYPALMVLDGSAGNVGIGTTSPGEKLAVKGDASYIEITHPTATSYSGMKFSEGGTPQGSIQNIGSTFATVARRGNFEIFHNTGGNLTLQHSSGNVGIGTSSPNGKLSFENSVETRKIVLYEGGNNDFQFYGFGIEANKLIYTTAANTDDHVFYSGASATTRNELMRIDGGGNVGIGTTSPGYKLQVNGTIAPEGNEVNNLGASTNRFNQLWAKLIYDINNGRGLTNQVLTSTGSGGIAWANASTVIGGPYLPLTAGSGSPLTGDLYIEEDSLYLLNASSNYWRVQNNSSGKLVFKQGTTQRGIWSSGELQLANNLIVDNKIGVGTTSPQAFTKVDVRSGYADGDAAIAAYGYNGVSGYAISGHAYAIDNTHAGSATGLRGISNGGRTVSGSVNIGGYFTASGSESNYALITDSGTVGIGTSSPSEKLDVAGNIKIQAALLSNQNNTNVDTGTEAIASVVLATYTAAFFDFVIKKGTNVRSGTVYACHDGTSVAFTETSTNDLGDTSDVTLNVVISTIYLQLQATTTSDDWSVKSLIRAI